MIVRYSSPRSLVQTCPRSVCFVLLILSVAAAPSTQAQLAEGQGRFLGNISKNDPDPDFTTYWNQVTPENGGKWERVEGTRDQMNWATLDLAYSLAQQNGFPFKQHTFVWGNQQPDWIGALSATEQRAEVEEWIAAYFQRYPGTDYVDVVNEPISQPPPYKAAIGGDNGLYGTGWDWVIWTFERARFYADQYGSSAKLLLNEYDILKNAGKKDTYLQIVGLLQDRGLIDGVGLQGHFLEGTALSTVSANLQDVADTGLPIYISELDLNFSDDQAQRNRYEALFPILWEHPSVEGVTLWGYKQGQIWRSNAYLVRSDGSERPALQWLRDYLTSDPSDALRLEAEAYDAQQGVNTYATFIGFADDGDWVRFEGVDLSGGPAGLRVRYAKGNTTSTRVEVRLGGPSGTLLGELATLNTGGWNTFTEAEASLTGSGGTADVYFVFKGGAGAGNFDWFELSGGGTSGAFPEAGVWYKLYNSDRGGYLDTNGDGGVDLNPGGSGSDKEWRFVDAGGGYYWIDNRASGRGALDTSNGGVVQWKPSDTPSGDDKLWQVVDAGGNSYRFLNKQSGRDYLYADATAAVRWNTGSTGMGTTWQPEAAPAALAGVPLGDAGPTDAAHEGALGVMPATVTLGGSYPNPFNPQTVIRFALPNEMPARLVVYDVLGREVARLVDRTLRAGWHEVTFQPAGAPSGLYLYRLEAGGEVRVGRVLFAK